jgi:hypothetical protein
MTQTAGPYSVGKVMDGVGSGCFLNIFNIIIILIFSMERWQSPVERAALEMRYTLVVSGVRAANHSLFPPLCVPMY